MQHTKIVQDVQKVKHSIISAISTNA